MISLRRRTHPPDKQQHVAAFNSTSFMIIYWRETIMFNIKSTKNVEEKKSTTNNTNDLYHKEMMNKTASNTEATQKNKTFISAGSEITGNISVTGDIHINGYVIGNITVTNGSITVMRSGKVEGDMQAPHIMIDGSISGRCDADSLEILEHGQLNGIASANRFSIKTGGIFVGQSEYSEAKSAESQITEDNTKQVAQNNQANATNKKIETKKPSAPLENNNNSSAV
jgi:cytoskeletal protein CcmA (bactofilin family)